MNFRLVVLIVIVSRTKPDLSWRTSQATAQPTATQLRSHPENR